MCRCKYFVTDYLVCTSGSTLPKKSSRTSKDRQPIVGETLSVKPRRRVTQGRRTQFGSPSVRLPHKTTTHFHHTHIYKRTDLVGVSLLTTTYIYIGAARGTFCVSTRQAIELDLSQLPTCNHHREATRKGWGRRADQRPTYHLTRGLQVGVQFRRGTPNRLAGGPFSRRISVETRINFIFFI